MPSTPASIARHPIHPMLIVFPIGLWIFSLVTDFIYQGGASMTWYVCGWYAMAGGILGALAAAIPGFIDLLSLPKSRAKTIGAWHMGLNLAIVTLFIVNFLLRPNMPSGAAAPFVLSIVGVGLLLASGWLGGEMVYVNGVAVDKNATLGEPSQRAAGGEESRSQAA